MSSNSDEESDFSDSEIEKYMEKPYELLKAGNYEVQLPNGTFRCPFCIAKKKQKYKYVHLYQHAIGNSNGSSSKSAKQKANHLALVLYMENDLANEAEPLKLRVQPSTVATELYCWPWVGIVANISKDRDLLTKFSKYKILTFPDENLSIIEFESDWNGFKKAMEFESSFEQIGQSKKEWNERKASPGLCIFGWFAGEDDYKSEGLVGEYLRSKGGLKTIKDVFLEAKEERNKIVDSLVSAIGQQNENLDQLKIKYDISKYSLSTMLEEKEKLHCSLNEEIRKLQRKARERILNEEIKLNIELEIKKDRLNSWSKELDKREALVEHKRQKLNEEKAKALNDLRNTALQMGVCGTSESR